jgi:hypothetical protein
MHVVQVTHKKLQQTKTSKVLCSFYISVSHAVGVEHLEGRHAMNSIHEGPTTSIECIRGGVE